MIDSHFRSRELLALAEGETCTLRLPGCLGGPVVCCHSNLERHGKGKSVKAHDCFVAFGCTHCHYEIDQGKNLTREERSAAWERGFIATLPRLLAKAFGAIERRPRVERRASSQRSTRTPEKCVPRRVA